MFDTQHPFWDKLETQIEITGSHLCVGLDPRTECTSGSAREFLTRVIGETLPHAAAFKPNMAYFEAMGAAGFRLLEEVRNLIPTETPLILDGKRGDIGETQKYYARACYDVWGADAVTLNPYLGAETLEPFLEYRDRAVYLLAVTSNPGSADLQLQITRDGVAVFELVQAMTARSEQIGLVIGLTQAGVLSQIRDVPLLLPGLGAQGGDLSPLSRQKRRAPILINVSRGILYANPEHSFGQKAQHYAADIRAALYPDSTPTNNQPQQPK